VLRESPVDVLSNEAGRVVVFPGGERRRKPGRSWIGWAFRRVRGRFWSTSWCALSGSCCSGSWPGTTGTTLADRLTAWDGQWYLRIATYGYADLPGTVDAASQPYPDAPMVFFPLYPALVSAVKLLGMEVDSGSERTAKVSLPSRPAAAPGTVR
jgi:hypothetical protein